MAATTTSLKKGTIVGSTPYSFKDQIAKLENRATDVAELLEETARFRCEGCGDPLTEDHMLPVFDDPRIKRDHLRRPLGPYDKESCTPNRLSEYAYCLPGCLRRRSKNAPLLPPEKEDHYITLMLAWRHNITDAIQPLPAIESMSRYQCNKVGLSAKQRVSLLRFPDTMVFVQKHPLRHPPFPKESNAVSANDPSVLAYYRLQELPTPLQDWILRRDTTRPPTGLIGLDSDPDSDDDVSLFANQVQDEKFTTAWLEETHVTKVANKRARLHAVHPTKPKVAKTVIRPVKKLKR